MDNHTTPTRRLISSHQYFCKCCWCIHRPRPTQNFWRLNKALNIRNLCRLRPGSYPAFPISSNLSDLSSLQFTLQLIHRTRSSSWSQKMDIDDDFLSFSPPKEASPQPHYRRLKRLKNSGTRPPKEVMPESVDDPLLFPHVDFARLEAMENDSEFPEFDNDFNSSEELNFSQESLSRGDDDENEMGEDDTTKRDFKEEGRKTKRVLDFGLDAPGGEDGNEGKIGEDDDEGFEPEKDKETIDNMDPLDEKEVKEKKKKTKVKSDSGDKSEANARRSNKRREEKERKLYLEQLHAESQKVLRETRNASFKPIPVVHKPISSVLEKIRKRKLEISKKAMTMNDGCLSEGFNSGDTQMEPDDRDGQNVAMEKETVSPSVDVEMSINTFDMDECKDSPKKTIPENNQNKESPTEEFPHAFRAPVDDTQDLFYDSEPNGATAEPDGEALIGPSQEDFAPSLLPMHLKFDSVPMDDSSSDEEDNDKENVAPAPIGAADCSSSPKGDPVKDFVDDEAEEEDDSDHDPLRTQEDAEDEDHEDFEELAHMIATEYKEKPIDNEMRNELHQKWLQQQDAAGTDKIMQRLGCGSGLQHTDLPDKEPETDEEDDGSDDEVSEDSMPQDSVRMNTKKAKELLLQFLAEKEDVYLSDDDDDKQRRHAQYLIRNEEQGTLVAPAEDESSREVFALIKKMNIVPDQKKKQKPPSFFDSVLKGGNANSSSKSSFLGRASSLPVKSAKRPGSGAARHFVFGRDDSNSRSSILASEDSLETVTQEVRKTRTIAAKYSSSQTKLASQTINTATETVSKTSLLEILKQPSAQRQACNQDTTIDLTKSIFTFRAPKKPVKIEGRS